MACETSPIRTQAEVIKRYAKSPIVKNEPKSEPVNGNDTNSRLTKLEMNLKRFEDERKIFALEQEKFEREKRHMEQMRYQRLLEFERKRSMQQKDREQLAIQAAAIALAEIEKQRIVALEQQRHRQTKSKSRERSFSGSNLLYADDYESSTATSSSSRDGDFNDFAHEIPFDSATTIEDVQASEINNNEASTIAEEGQVVNGAAGNQSLLSRLIFGKAKPMKTAHTSNKDSYLNIRVDDGGPISIKRIIFIESPLVWHQVIEIHQEEWEKTMRLRNRCVASFLLLMIYFGFGGLMFRFIEGAFENFYKCGVRRVKRDFVDHLWTTSQDLRFSFIV